MLRSHILWLCLLIYGKPFRSRCIVLCWFECDNVLEISLIFKFEWKKKNQLAKWVIYQSVCWASAISKRNNIAFSEKKNLKNQQEKYMQIKRYVTWTFCTTFSLSLSLSPWKLTEILVHCPPHMNHGVVRIVALNVTRCNPNFKMNTHTKKRIESKF